MQRDTIGYYRKRLRLSFIESLVFAMIICAFLLPSCSKIEFAGERILTIYLNGIEVGTVDFETKPDEMMILARRQVIEDAADLKENNALVFIDVDMEVIEGERVFGTLDDEEVVVQKMADIMKKNVRTTLHRSYAVKINETLINLNSYVEVNNFLQQTLAPYDADGKYKIELQLDPEREINVLETVIRKKDDFLDNFDENQWTIAGAEVDFRKAFADVFIVKNKHEDYEHGLVNLEYADKIEVVEAYLLEDEIDTVDEAVALATKEQETQVIYEVVPGDTLSQICLINDIPLDELIAINDELENENTIIRPGQELVITVPEPALSVLWETNLEYMEDYEAPVEYVLNNDWYTTQEMIRQQPSAGRRRVVATISYKNEKEIGRELLKEEVYVAAIPKIVEKGTKLPPTYIKPISGGRQTSSFGTRRDPITGATATHNGVDWALPIGSSVVASNAGTVVCAGWVNGYGYAVYINHSDGRQTRYGHLSKVLVKTGQSVSQGERIALSGNTGRSTGPHVHFEIRINGKAVNPLKYLGG